MQEADREKAIAGKNHSGSTEKSVSNSSAQNLSWISENKKYLFLQRGEGVPEGENDMCETMEL